MLKKSLNDLCINPFNEFNYTWPILIAGDVKNGYNGMTVSWGGLGTLWGKPVGFVFVRKSRHTYNFIENSDSVTLSFLNEDYANAKKIFGKKSVKKKWMEIVFFDSIHFYITTDQNNFQTL